MKKINIEKFLFILISVVVYIAWFFIYTDVEFIYNLDEERRFVSWLGIILFLCSIKFWIDKLKNHFSLIIIFLSFFFIFNFGQSLFWAFSCHAEKELGTCITFGRELAGIDIYKAQWMFIICYFMFNVGVFLKFEKNTIERTNIFSVSVEKFEIDLLFRISLILAIFSLPAELFVSTRNLFLSRQNSYHYLYYGASKLPVVIDIFSGLFFPSIIGLIIGSRFNKKYCIILYAVFCLDAGLKLLVGDRGEWINKLIILLWMEHTFHKRINKRTFFLIIVLSFISMYIISAIVSMRNSGVYFYKIMENIKNSANPFFKMIVEFGESMGITSIVISENVIYPYGNSYLVSLLTMPTSRIGRMIFGENFLNLGRWFSKEYLQITYGADFNIIAEAVMNCGEFIAPFMLLFIGVLIGCIFKYATNTKYINYFFITIGILPILLKIVRSTSWFLFVDLFWISGVYLFMNILITNRIKWKKSCQEIYI